MSAHLPETPAVHSPGVAPNVLPPILRPYLLVLLSVPFYVDRDGRRWLEALWAKDLLEHTRYIKCLTLVSTAVRGSPPPGAVAMDQVDALRGITCIEVPPARNTREALLRLPGTWSLFWRALRHAEVVHASVASWPLPEAWILIPLLWFRPRPLYINVESAFWRLAPGSTAGAARRLRAVLSERLNRYCLERSALSTFTHDGYRQTLLKTGHHRGHVVQASWIDEHNLIPEARLLARLQASRARDDATPRLVFAGRLSEEKGILLLLDAALALLGRGVKIRLDIYGEGALAAECTRRIRTAGRQEDIHMRGVLPYGDSFFAALSGYDALVVPSLTDEQPRIVYDAFSQGLPAIASSTPGHIECVEQGVTGLFFRAGDRAALEDVLSVAAADRRSLNDMAPACLRRATRLTHRRMHEARWRLLVEAFPDLTRAGVAGEAVLSGNV